MNIIAMFVLGLFLGWLAEWAIDWAYWRGLITRITNENKGLKERVSALEATRDQKRISTKGVPLADKDGNDNLQAIKGIGPIFAKRLKEAGVQTFEELSRLSSKDLEGILGNLYKRFFSKEESIRAQAKEFARQRKQQH